MDICSRDSIIIYISLVSAHELSTSTPAISGNLELMGTIYFPSLFQQSDNRKAKFV
jgi:hypothetical protein